MTEKELVEALWAFRYQTQCIDCPDYFRGGMRMDTTPNCRCVCEDKRIKDFARKYLKSLTKKTLDREVTNREFLNNLNDEDYIEVMRIYRFGGCELCSNYDGNDCHKELEDCRSGWVEWLSQGSNNRKYLIKRLNTTKSKGDYEKI